MKDLVIIGSGPAGLSAAVYAQRAMMDVVVLEKEPFSGGQIVNTERVDNYLGLYGINGYDMAVKFRQHAEDLGAQFLNETVAEIRNFPDRKEVVLENGQVIETKAVVIATGAKHRSLGVPGEQELTGAGVSYCATCDGAFFKDKEVAVVGGGDVALEDAIYLSKICSKVTLIHRRDEFRAAKVLADQIEKTENIDFLPFTQIKEISGEPGNLQLTLINTAKNEQAGINVAGVFIAVGMLPVTQFAEGVVGLDDTGYVVAGEDCKTNVAGIFAAGDVRTKNVRQVATAVGDGASVIASVEEFLTR
jgi:thioredoxin reductase (NADPH)